MEEEFDFNDFDSEELQYSVISHFNYLPGEVSSLEKIGVLQSFPENYVLVEAGSKTEYCYIVKSGRVVGYEKTQSGEERIYQFNEKDAVFLESDLLFDWVVPVAFKTAKPSELICIDKPALMKAIAENPKISMDLIYSLSVKFIAAKEQIRNMSFQNASWKVCNLMLSFAKQYGVPYDGKVLIKEKISQQVMSNLLGINRITAVRIIKELKDLELVEQVNGFYCIRDMRKLKQYQDGVSRK
ncbi:MAG: Crp/Fnr family transcriptional regulator [Eubacteriales bacterium]|nr:Crp/Fnr family transcriptional regulator [Eubacteriales bacterium]